MSWLLLLLLLLLLSRCCCLAAAVSPPPLLLLLLLLVAQATRLVPGSHRWPQHRVPLESEVVYAEMPVGSVVFISGMTYHSAGGNSTDTPRLGMNLDFNAGFIAEEEIQVLSAPPHIARHFPKPLQRLCGYDTHGSAIGYFGDWTHPIATFDLEPIDWATAVAPSAAAAAATATAQQSKL